MNLGANIFKIAISLWYLPLVKYSKKKIREVRVTCPEWFNMELPNEAFVPLRNHCYDQCKNICLRVTYSFIKIMQPISANYNWENGVKQIKITEENLSQSCILCQLIRDKGKDPNTRVKVHQTFLFYFYRYLPYICWVDVIYLTCVVFLKSLWWLVWIFCTPTLFT